MTNNDNNEEPEEEVGFLGCVQHPRDACVSPERDYYYKKRDMGNVEEGVEFLFCKRKDESERIEVNAEVHADGEGVNVMENGVCAPSGDSDARESNHKYNHRKHGKKPSSSVKKKNNVSMLIHRHTL